MIYAINYDLRQPGRNYSDLYAAIKGCGAWWHYLGSVWLVETSLSAESVWQRLAPCLDQNDRMLIIGVTKNYTGWLPREAWQWIRQRLLLAA
jgi:hypothetical protein